MLHALDRWIDGHALPAVFLHTVAIYLYLIGILRWMGKRQLGQLTVVDLVIVVIMGSAVETAMVNGNTDLSAGLLCAGTLLLLNYLFSRLLLRFKPLRHLLVGGPILLVHDGQFVEDHLQRCGLTHADVMEALHEREQADIGNIRFAVLETDGSINVVPIDADVHCSKLYSKP